MRQSSIPARNELWVWLLGGTQEARKSRVVGKRRDTRRHFAVQGASPISRCTGRVDDADTLRPYRSNPLRHLLPPITILFADYIKEQPCVVLISNAATARNLDQCRRQLAHHSSRPTPATRIDNASSKTLPQLQRFLNYNASSMLLHHATWNGSTRPPLSICSSHDSDIDYVAALSSKPCVEAAGGQSLVHGYPRIRSKTHTSP